MKDAFVASDAQKVSTSSKATLEKLKSISDSDLGKIKQAHFSKIKKMLVSIAGIYDIENQHSHFVVFNQNSVPIMKVIKGLKPQLYIENVQLPIITKGCIG